MHRTQIHEALKSCGSEWPSKCNVTQFKQMFLREMAAQLYLNQCNCVEPSVFSNHPGPFRFTWTTFAPKAQLRQLCCTRENEDVDNISESAHISFIVSKIKFLIQRHISYQIHINISNIAADSFCPEIYWIYPTISVSDYVSFMNPDPLPPPHRRLRFSRILTAITFDSWSC